VKLLESWCDVIGGWVNSDDGCVGDECDWIGVGLFVGVVLVCGFVLLGVVLVA